MPSWVSSRVSGYRVASGVGSFVPDFLQLNNAGTVDSNIITRAQYNISGVYGPTKFVNMRTQLVMDITHAELFNNGYFVDDGLGIGNWVRGPYRVSARLYVVPADAFGPGVVPTPGQILNGGKYGHGTGLRVYVPSDDSWSDTGIFTLGTRRFRWDFQMESPDKFSQGTKYWAMMMPVRYYRPLNLNPTVRIFTTLQGYNGTSIGRGFSWWTNRKPLKPVITSPVSGNAQPPGASFPLTVDFNDPDEVVVAGQKSPDTHGANGVQVQFRPKPTELNPNPGWSDLPLRSSATNLGPSPQPGWSIVGSTRVNNMAQRLLFDDLMIRAGGDPISPSTPQGYLPKGDWQLRVRSFDPGMPWNYLSSGGGNVGVRPVNGVPKDWTPSNYFFDLISPWSDAVDITIPTQVPPPVPLSPIDDNAVNGGQSITLAWRYRNTAGPPRLQKTRTIEIRREDEEEWTTLVTGSSSAAFHVIPDGLEPGRYFWRVSVTDTDDEVSDLSESASFWVVPAPNSGGGRPDPQATIDGATLGCGKHRVFVYRRGGKKRVAEITDMVHVDWGRLRDDISTAKINVKGWSIDCGNLLAILQTWAYELVIFRDNGYSNDRVWEGPITLLTYEEDEVVVDAKDVMVYPYRRIIKQLMNDMADGDTVTNRAVRVLQNTLGPDDPNVLPYLTPIFNDDDAREYRHTPAYSRTAFEEIDDMASNAGLDYTAVGRSILVWSTKHRIGTLAEFKDADFSSPPIVSEYGMSMANVYSVSDGNGIHGEATRLDANGKDLTYGLVEMLSSTWASDTAGEHGTYTEAGLQTVIESFEQFAERSIADRYPPPVVVRVPDNTSLNPDAVVSIQQLVPGVVIPLRATATLRKVQGNQKLDALKVIEEAGNETVSVTMSPFSRDDAAIDGEEVEA